MELLAKAQSSHLECGNYSRILNRLNRNFTQLEVRRAFAVYQLMTILKENHHSFLIVEHDPMLYEGAERWWST